MLSIHNELASHADDFPAGYIEVSVFSRISYDRLKVPVEMLKGKTIQAGNGELSIRLKDVSWSSGLKAKLVPSTRSGKEVCVVPSSDLRVIVEVVIAADPSQLVSTVEVTLKDLKVEMRGENNKLVLEAAECTTYSRMSREKDADDKLRRHSINATEATYVEGHIGYGVIPRTIMDTISQGTEFALVDFFPAINFGPSMELKVLSGGRFLGIIPSEAVTLNSFTRCICNQGPDFKVEKSEVTNVVPPNPTTGDELAQIKIGGPIADNKDALSDFGSRPSNRDGLAGLYIPKSFARTLTVEIMPAIKLVAQDRGFIGYRADLSCGFDDFDITFDIAGGGIVVMMNLDISGSGYCDVNLFCVRLPIAWAAIQSTAKGQLEIGFYPAIDASGTLRLKSTLRKVDPGTYVAVVVGVGTALSFLSKGLSVLIDVALAGMLTIKLPIKLKEQISSYMGNKEWKLIEGFPLVDSAMEWPLCAPFDVDRTSLLASVGIDG